MVLERSLPEPRVLLFEIGGNGKTSPRALVVVSKL